MDPSLRSRAELIAKQLIASGDEVTDSRLRSACASDDALVDAVRQILQEFNETNTGTIVSSTFAIGPSDGSLPIAPEGQEIPGYTIRSLLGRGGFGSVWLATQHHPVKRDVAVKLVHAERLTGGYLDRFRLEVDLLARLNHPNIATLFDAGVTKAGLPYFVMEYVANASRIGQYCDDRQLPLGDRVRLLLDVLGAVSYLHSNAVVHRDLSSNNVLVVDVGGKPTPKVIDFGLAKLLESPEAHGQTQGGMGTPGFASPEQWFREPITTRSDVYSLGALLHALVAGSAPQIPKPGTKQEAVSRILREKGLAERAERLRTTPESLLRVVRGDLDWILSKALAIEPDLRYQTVSEFAEDLSRFLRNETVRARPQSLAYSARKFLQRNRNRVIAAAIVVPLLLVSPIIARTLTRAEETEKLRQSSLANLERGQELFGRARTGYDELDGLKARYSKVAAETEPHLPYWRRTREIAVFDSLRTLESQITRDLNDATTHLSAATEQAPDPDTEHRAKLQLEGLYWYLGNMTDRGLALQSEKETYERLARDLGVGTYAAELEGRASVVFVAPPSAEVHVFRHEEVEARRTPLAVDVRTGRTADPVLLVERVVAPDLPFRQGDLIRSVKGVPVRTESDFARVVDASNEEEALTVVLERNGGEVDVHWTPRRLPDETGEFGPELVDLRQQFGFWFQAYPLRPEPWSEVALDTVIDFPKGSYLAYITASGYAPARVPFVAPGAPDTITVRLLAEGDLPPGFEYVHEGPAWVGGPDPDYLQAMPISHEWVDGFAIARQEITLEEYFRFLNSPEIRPLIDEDGTMAPRSPAAAAILKERSDASKSLTGPMERFRVVPSRIALLDDDGSWIVDLTTQATPQWPLINVTLLGAMEYAHWRSEQSQGRWTFRVPTDVEWEKAARGVDRRTYVWGDYLMWPYCYNPKGHLGTSYPIGIGLVPYDESVYGARDMEGSADEWTVTRTLAGLAYRSRRGGHWNTTDDYRFKLETRVGTFPERTSAQNSLGVRLVADLPDDR